MLAVVVETETHGIAQLKAIVPATKDIPNTVRAITTLVLFNNCLGIEGDQSPSSAASIVQKIALRKRPSRRATLIHSGANP